jgi:WD40 repeat protein
VELGWQYSLLSAGRPFDPQTGANPVTLSVPCPTYIARAILSANPSKSSLVCLALSCCVSLPASGVLLQGGSDTEIRAWDLISGDYLRTFNERTATVSALTLKADCLLSGSHDERVCIWNFGSGEKVTRNGG